MCDDGEGGKETAKIVRSFMDGPLHPGPLHPGPLSLCTLMCTTSGVCILLLVLYHCSQLKYTIFVIQSSFDIITSATTVTYCGS